MSTGAFIGLAVVIGILVWVVVIAIRAVHRSDLNLELTGNRSACRNIRSLVEHDDGPNKEHALAHVVAAESRLDEAFAAFAGKDRAQTMRCLDICVAELRAARLLIQPDEPEDPDDPDDSDQRSV